MESLCIIEGCTSKIAVENASPEFRYTCKNHPREQQIVAACPGRKYDPRSDHQDEDARYQPNQFIRPHEEGRELESLNQGLAPLGYNPTQFQTIQMRRMRGRVPAWTQDDAKVKALILRSFPKSNVWATEYSHGAARQEDKATMWVGFIYFYYRLRMTISEVADTLDLTIEQAKNLKSRIRRAAAGLNTAGKKRGKRGRPCKIKTLENVNPVGTLHVRSDSHPSANLVHDLPSPAGFDRQGFSFDADSKQLIATEDANV